MCGIAGIYSLNKRIESSELKMMTDRIQHRGPDGDGHWIDVEGRVGLGHRRLSILDLSESGAQPMHYEHLSLTFNGEIYNYVELKKGLEKKGYKFQSETDTEVLMALYLEKGVDCLHELDGMFSFAIWDGKKKRLFCARDRFGEKPFYYSKHNNDFLFASEMKSLFGIRGLPRTINQKKLFYYLAYNVVELEDDFKATFYDGVDKLEPGHFMIVNSDGSITKERYWSVDLSKQTDNFTFTQAQEKFKELFITSVKRRLRSDVPVGSSLSGGLDSSSIVRTIANEIKNNNFQNTFSARFKNFEKDEGYFIDKVVENTSINDHHTWVDENYMIDNFNDIFYHQEEPFGSSSIVAQHAVMRLAKQESVTVLLDGQGADEYLVGYVKRYYKTRLKELYLNGKSEEFKKEKLAYEGLLERTYPFNAKEKFNLRFRGVLDKLKFFNSTTRKFNGINSDFVNFQESVARPFRTFYDLREQLKYSIEFQLPDLLRYADKNSMAFSREIRLPFLNHELVEFVFSLPTHYKLNDGWSKYLLRTSMDSYLPKEVAWRKEKVAFQPPQKAWSEDKKVVELMHEAKKILVKNKIIEEPKNGKMDWQILNAAQLFQNVV